MRRLRRRMTGPAPAGSLADARSLAALLDVPADELLGVLLQHRVDLVEQVVDVLGDLLLTLGDGRIDRGRRVVDLVVAPGFARLRLASGVTGSHQVPPRVPRCLE